MATFVQRKKLQSAKWFFPPWQSLPFACLFWCSTGWEGGMIIKTQTLFLLTLNGNRLKSKQLYIVQSALVCPQERKNKTGCLRLAQSYPNLASMKSIKTCYVHKGHPHLCSYRIRAQREEPIHAKLQPIHTLRRDG